MVLILSQRNDISSYKVIEWLQKSGIEFILHDDISRANVEEVQVTLNNQYSDFSIFLSDGRKIISSQVSSVWFRGGDMFDLERMTAVKFRDSSLNHGSSNFLQGEWTMLSNWMFSILLGKHRLGNPSLYFTNKLQMLEFAASVGLSIPSTIITNRKSHIDSFYKSNKEKIISKAIYNSFNFSNISGHYSHPTFSVTSHQLKVIPNCIGLSLFQEEIAKDFDIRCCIFENTIYSLAIFSQNDEKTSTDYRCYNINRPNRVVPFELDKIVKDKLLKLFHKIKLNFGLIDLVKAVDGNIYFLEVNPIGQFDNISSVTGIPLEKLISQYLQNNE